MMDLTINGQYVEAGHSKYDARYSDSSESGVSDAFTESLLPGKNATVGLSELRPPRPALNESGPLSVRPPVKFPFTVKLRCDVKLPIFKIPG